MFWKSRLTCEFADIERKPLREVCELVLATDEPRISRISSMSESKSDMLKAAAKERNDDVEIIQLN